MSARRSSRLPYALLGALSLVCFGGPAAVLVAVRGGRSAYWPPDRPLEWITLALVLALFVGLFCACVTFGWWHQEPGKTKRHDD
jgi:hypothetical protein